MRVPLDVIKTVLEFPKLKKHLEEKPETRLEVVQNINEIHGTFITLQKTLF